MKKSTLTQRRILDEAEKLFLQEAIDKVKISDIAQAAGIAKGTVYLYFPSKDDIVWQVTERYFVHFMKILSNLEFSYICMESIDTIIDAFFDFILAHEKEMYMLHQASFHGYLGKARIESKYLGIWQGPIRDWLSKGMSLGRFKITNLDFTVDFMIASIHGVFDNFITGDLPYDHVTIRFELKQIIRKLLG